MESRITPRSLSKAEAIRSSLRKEMVGSIAALRCNCLVPIIKNLVLPGLIKSLCSQHHRATSNKFCFIFPRAIFASRAKKERSNISNHRHKISIDRSK